MLKRMALEYFKGVQGGLYDFSDPLTCFCGKNGTGKTTIPDAWFWLWTDKDYDLQSSPEVHPDFMEESEPSVTVLMELCGKEITFRKYQTDMRTKKQKELGAPVRIANRYEINGVPKSQKDFLSDAESYGIDTENFLLLSHPEVLTGMKVADRRKIIFELAGDITDLEVAQVIPDCEGAAELLKNYKLDEIMAMQKATVKRCNEQIDSIPNQILGMERIRVPIDETLFQRRSEIEQEISKKIADRDAYLSKSDLTAYDMDIKALENERNELYNKANMARLSKLSEAHRAADKAQDAYLEARKTVLSLNNSGNAINDGFKRQTLTKKTILQELESLDTLKPNIESVCPACGQALPEDRVEAARKKWEEGIYKKVKELNERLNAAETMIAGYREEGKALAEQKKQAEETVEACRKAMVAAQENVSKYTEGVTPDYSEIDAKISAVGEERSKVAKYKEAADKLTAEINVLKTSLADVIRKINQSDNNARIDEEISKLKASLAEYVQSKADAENILYQLQLISRKKNELLSDTVNKHFSRVKWRLFVTQKNGEVKDDCTPLVLCKDGKYRDMTYGANTAAIQAAKIDICQGLQKYHEKDLPIWVDGAECFDEDNRNALGKNGGQLILLCVTDDERLVTR